MSGYDFFSGFFGSLGDQMKESQQRKLALEDEDRADKRALSREEALAKSRDRIAAQAEERKRLATPPTMQSFMQGGKKMEHPVRYNPDTQGYDVLGPDQEAVPTPAEQKMAQELYLANQTSNDKRQGYSASAARSAANNAARIRAAEISANKPSGEPVDPNKPIIDAVADGFKAYLRAPDPDGFVKKIGLEKGASEDAIRSRLAEIARKNRTLPAAQAAPKSTVLGGIENAFNEMKDAVSGAQSKKVSTYRADHPEDKDVPDDVILRYLASQGK